MSPFRAIRAVSTGIVPSSRRLIPCMLAVGLLCGVWPCAASKADSPPRSDATQDLFTAVLGTYVHAGRVDYPGLCKDRRFQEYLSQLSSTDPSAITDDDERLAFWINAYNAFTIKLICDNYPIESIRDIRFSDPTDESGEERTGWDEPFVQIGGAEYTLNDIEHGIIRGEFDDARIHFALVCAAKSCPPLRPEAYDGARLDEQLDEQGRLFLSERTKNYFDTEHRVAYLSTVMEWYGEDFGSNDTEVLLALLPFVPGDVADDVRADPNRWEIQYTVYDWSLNE